MSNIVRLPCVTTLPLNPDDVLQSAVGKLENVVILGWDKDGEMYAAASGSNMAAAVYLATKFIHKEMRGDFE